MNNIFLLNIHSFAFRNDDFGDIFDARSLATFLTANLRVVARGAAQSDRHAVCARCAVDDRRTLGTRPRFKSDVVLCDVHAKRFVFVLLSSRPPWPPTRSKLVSERLNGVCLGLLMALAPLPDDIVAFVTLELARGLVRCFLPLTLTLSLSRSLCLRRCCDAVRRICIRWAYCTGGWRRRASSSATTPASNSVRCASVCVRAYVCVLDFA